MSIFSKSKTAITFDDVLLMPVRSSVKSRSDVKTDTYLTTKIKLKVPIIPANMDTITESLMAVTMAREGSIGIIHRFQSIEREVEEIKKVKRIEDLVLWHPLTVFPNTALSDVHFLTDRYGAYSFLVIDEKKKLLGILTLRDYQFEKNLNIKVEKLMTPMAKLVTAPSGINISVAKKILQERRLEKLPLIHKDGTLAGLITSRDIANFESKPDASRDAKGRLMVGGSVGATGDYLDRAIELDKAEVDTILVDVAHGHALHILNALKILRKRLPKQQIIAGNVATAEAALDLVKIGVDAVKVGIGPGSVCTTRIMAGVGVPQLTAIHDVASICMKAGIPVIADGGAKNSGDIVKALAVGADTVMAGNLFAGTTEAPGDVVVVDNKRYKIYRGSSTSSTAEVRNKLGDFGKLAKHQTNYVEGTEALVPFKGPVSAVLSKMLGGITSGMSYAGAHTIPELKKNAKFVLVTANGVRENSYHDVSHAN